MNMKKILFIGSLNTKKECFDGERIKTTFTKEVLSKYFDVDIINLSHFKFFNLIRIIFAALFLRRKYMYIVISKDRGGAKIIHKTLSLLKYSMQKVVYFQIGPFLYDLVRENDKNKKLFISDRAIIVETKTLANQLIDIGFRNIDIVPNFKPNYNLELVIMPYPKERLKLVYLSRIERMKGIYHLLDELIDLNKEKTIFEIDIFGLFMSADDKTKINNYVSKYDWINYCGSLNLNSKPNYLKLQQYDLHVFPTFYGEGFPGTIIDFFIAGVPTLSSSFARSSEIFNGNESIIYKQGDSDDLKDKLLNIYNNQQILNELRKNSFERRNEFTPDILEKYIKEALINNE